MVVYTTQSRVACSRTPEARRRWRTSRTWRFRRHGRNLRERQRLPGGSRSPLRQAILGSTVPRTTKSASMTATSTCLRPTRTGLPGTTRATRSPARRSSRPASSTARRTSSRGWCTRSRTSPPLVGRGLAASRPSGASSRLAEFEVDLWQSLRNDPPAEGAFTNALTAEAYLMYKHAAGFADSSFAKEILSAEGAYFSESQQPLGELRLGAGRATGRGYRRRRGTGCRAEVGRLVRARHWTGGARTLSARTEGVRASAELALHRLWTAADNALSQVRERIGRGLRSP